MAHFIGFVKGNRGEASRLGSKDSGMYATDQGWNIGASVYVRFNEETGKDEVTIRCFFDLNRRQNIHRYKFLVTVFDRNIR